MQKVAQKRSLLNKLREMTNVSGIATEKFFNPEFQEIMDRLRDDTDDPIRAIITGEVIGSASPSSDATSLKDLLKSAKSNVNRREYMKAIADLGRFHKNMHDVITILSSFSANVDKLHEKFLFEGLDEDSKSHLKNLKDRFSKNNSKSLIKEASILDFFTNIATERGRALAAWEKRYPKQIGKLKKDTSSLLTNSERLLNIVLSTLKELASARATRNPDKYIESSQKIIKAYNTYNVGFKSFYETNVKGFLDKVLAIDPVKVDTTDKSKELGNQNIEVEKKDSIAPLSTPTSTLPSPAPNAVPQTPTSTLPPSIPPSGSVEIPPPGQLGSPKLPADLMDSVPTTVSDTDILPPPMDQADTIIPSGEPEKKSAHQKFYNLLESMGNEHPIILAKFITKYATSIQSTDPITAIKLFKIVKSIKE